MEIIGKKIGRYDIQSHLGEGGMAVVYRAHDSHLDTDVVIKIPRWDLKKFRHVAPELHDSLVAPIDDTQIREIVREEIPLHEVLEVAR